MSETDEGPWRPPRPPSRESVWGATTPAPSSARAWARGAAPPPSGVRPDRSLSPRAPTTRTRPQGLIARLWSGASAGRRILVAYLALAALIGTVAGLGGALQPTYGTLAPLGGVAVDDIRSEPAPAPWAVDLAATLAPGAPAECLRFTAIDVARGLVAVRTDTALSYGFGNDATCQSVPDGYRSRLALLDTDDGVVRWTHDTAADFDGTDTTQVASVDTTAGGTRLLVRAISARSTVVETLALSNGRVLSTTGELRRSDEDRFAAAGDVIALGRRSTDGLSFDYELRDARKLSSVVWTGEGNPTATMIALDDRLLLGDEATQQILLSTGVARPWNAALNTSLGFAVRDGIVYAPRTTGSGVTTSALGGFSAISRTGRTLWTSALTLRGSFSLARSCLAVTNFRGDRLSCLDYTTGETLWTRSIGTFSSAASALGQRSDDIYTVSTSSDPRVVVLDGATGRERYSAAVPAGSVVVATGRTVGYALAFGISGSRTTVIAFDLSGGRRLWTRASQLQVSLWGGHLVDIGLDGLVRRLDG